jgi:hypothetical protein
MVSSGVGWRGSIAHPRQQSARNTDGDRSHRRNQFNSILLYSDVRSGKWVISADSGPACSPPSPRRVLYGQQQLTDPFITFTVDFLEGGYTCKVPMTGEDRRNMSVFLYEVDDRRSRGPLNYGSGNR